MPASPIETLDRAHALIRLGQVAEAVSLLQPLAEQYPDNLEAWFTLGQAQGMLERQPQAEFAFLQAARLRPDMPEAHFNVALALAYQNKLRDSLRSFVAARKLNPDIPGLDGTLLQVLLETLQDEHDMDSGSKAAFPPLAEDPLVSVVIPTQNRAHMLRDALESVCGQSYRNWEAIVVNDGGEDVSTVVKSLPSGMARRIAQFHSPTCRGQANARNTGIGAAQGAIIAFLDDDDLYKPEHLQALVAGLRDSAGALVYTRAEAVWEKLAEGRRVDVKRGLASPWYRYSRALLLVRNFMPIDNWGVRRECFEHYGKFDETLPCAEDWDLLLRFSAHGGFHQLSQVTTEVHVRDETVDSVSKRNRLAPACELLYRRYAADGHEWVELARELYLKSLP